MTTTLNLVEHYNHLVDLLTAERTSAEDNDQWELADQLTTDIEVLIARIVIAQLATTEK